MKTRRSRTALITCLTFAAIATAARAADATVCTVTDRADDISRVNTLRWCVAQVNSGVHDEIDIAQPGTYPLETPLQIDRDVDIAAHGIMIQPGETFDDDTLIRIGCGNLACGPAVTITELQMWSGGLPGWRAIDVRAGSVLTLDHANIESFDNALDGGSIHADRETLVHLFSTQIRSSRGAHGGAVYSAGVLLELVACQIQGSQATSEGGAIYFRASPALNPPGRLAIDSSEFTNNATAVSGGAIFATGPATVISVSVLGSRFTGNTAITRGGAFHGFADITRSTFASNRARTGGALYLNENSLVADSMFSSNQAFQGGAIAFLTSATTLGLTLRGSTLGKNDFDRQNGSIGAGIYLSRGNHLVENSTLTANGSLGTVNAFSTTGGGLAAVGGASVELRHATLEANAGDTGAGVHVSSTSTIAVSSSIVADSLVGTDCSILGTLSETTSLSTDTSCGFSYRANPLLGPLGQNGGPTPTHLPAVTSPVINQATCFASTDQRGRPRPAIPGSSCDIGSVEVR